MVFKGCEKQINSQTVAVFMIIVYILQTAEKTQHVPHGKKNHKFFLETGTQTPLVAKEIFS